MTRPVSMVFWPGCSVAILMVLLVVVHFGALWCGHRAHCASPNPEKSSLECSVRPLAAATAPKKLRFMPLVRPTAQHWGTWQLCGGRVRRASNR